MNMTTLIEVTPYAASALGVAMMARALHLHSESRPQTADGNQRKLTLVLSVALAMPSLAQAAAVDLRTATESGNAIIMYLSGVFAAVGIVAAGVAMMMGRQSIAKWVKTMWGNMGLEAAGVSSFSP